MQKKNKNYIKIHTESKTIVVVQNWYTSIISINTMGKKISANIVQRN